MREENSKMQLSLKAAVDVKLAKEGEVSILRRNIEKVQLCVYAITAQMLIQLSGISKSRNPAVAAKNGKREGRAEASSNAERDER